MRCKHDCGCSKTSLQVLNFLQALKNKLLRIVYVLNIMKDLNTQRIGFYSHKILRNPPPAPAPPPPPPKARFDPLHTLEAIPQLLSLAAENQVHWIEDLISGKFDNFVFVVLVGPPLDHYRSSSSYSGSNFETF